MRNYETEEAGADSVKNTPKKINNTLFLSFFIISCVATRCFQEKDKDNTHTQLFTAFKNGSNKTLFLDYTFGGNFTCFSHYNKTLKCSHNYNDEYLKEINLKYYPNMSLYTADYIIDDGLRFCSKNIFGNMVMVDRKLENEWSNKTRDIIIQEKIQLYGDTYVRALSAVKYCTEGCTSRETNAISTIIISASIGIFLLGMLVIVCFFVIVTTVRNDDFIMWN